MNRDIVKIVLNKCLGLKKKESLLIVCDEGSSGLARDLYDVSKVLGYDVILTMMVSRRIHGEEPPRVVARALRASDAALLVTSKSLSHTKARKQACKKYNTRIASLPGITPAIFRRSLDLNYNNLRRKVSRVAGYLSRGRALVIRTKKGTYLEMSIRGRKGFSDDGIYSRQGGFGNLPAGEACIAPVEGTTNGRLIVDGSAPLVGRVSGSKEIMIKNGYIQNIPFPKIREEVKSLGKCALNVAEFGIGLNPKARVTGNTLEDEKTLGTAHLAIGNNKSFGGRVYCPCHLDFVFLRPDVFIDGKKLVV